MRQLLLAINALLLLAIIGAAFLWQPAADEIPLPGIGNAHEVAPKGPTVALAAVPMGGDFTLDGPKGAVSLRDFRGRLVLLYFGYTYCPDVCPTSLLVWVEALGNLNAQELAKVQPIFVSVDPERDSVARLAEYTAFFHPAILGLTGQPVQLAAIASQFGAAYSREESASSDSYAVDHTAQTYLIDRDGRLVASLPHSTTPGQMLAEIRKLLPST